ncbi:MAG: hypothetical protein ABFS05_12310 [Bacteroidota bacterium]
MRTHWNYIGFFFLLVLFVAGACNKPDDNSRPNIYLDAPTEYTNFLVGDTMKVSGAVFHTKPISSLKIAIRDEMNHAVSAPKYLYPSSSSYHFDVDYIIDEAGLATGTYTLAITVSDGQTATNFFRNIRITGLDQYFERLMVFCRPGILKTYVYAIDSAWNLQNVLNLNHGFVDTEINSGDRKLFLVKPEPSILYAFDLDDPVPEPWLLAGPPYPLFNDVFISDQLTYIASANGEIKGLDKLGDIVFVTAQDPDTIPVLLHRHQNIILSYCERRGGPQKLIRQHFIGTGVARDFTTITFSVAAMFDADEEFCLLLGNYEGYSMIYKYQVDENYLGGHTNLPGGNIRDAVKISPDDYLIALDEGIYHYSYASGYISAWRPDIDVEIMAFDETRMLLYCAKGHNVTVFRADNGDLVQEIEMPYPVYDLHIQYNI